MYVTSCTAGVRTDDLYAFWFSSIETQSVSPDGVVVRHVLNDAGAAHSGLHYVWILHKRAPWSPWRVVASGWSEPRGAREAITWLDGATFEIELADKKRGGTLVTRRIQLTTGQ
jgi:hypothetical protein